jgi:predicted dehydrogenase/threonine dehydrogenase-like Zn-dependent dehydrogenase
MKQITQNLKKGELLIREVPVPACKPNGILVKTYYSAVSVGTEKMKLKNADMNYLQMAKAKPEQVKQVANTVKQLGMKAAYRKVMNKLDSLSPLGYSCTGKVVEVGENVRGITVGDIVACGGAGYANHAEVNYIPQNLCAKVPFGVDNREASLTTIASIALQGFRQAEVNIGENIAIIGLGLLGQILVQLINANGCRAFGFDLDASKVALANNQGAHFATVPDKVDYSEEIASLTNGYGCDAVIITTGTSSNDPIITAGKIARDRGKIVDIGITKMDLPWDLYYHKELDFRFSRSYGPGRYDPSYEESGNDYPIGYVRWTEQRNMESVLQLLKDGMIDFKKLITHEVDLAGAEKLFDNIKGDEENFLGVIIEYDGLVDTNMRIVKSANTTSADRKLTLGGIGAGNYASTMLYPFLNNKEVSFKGIATATGINAKDKADKLGFNYATTDYKSLLSDKDINTMLIATRHDQHAKMVIEALKADKNVYVEKPLAITTDELSSIKNELEISGKLIMVGYNRRFAPSIQYLKKKLDRNTAYSIYYQVNAGHVPMDNWYQSPEQGGRLIGEVGHFVDTLQFLLESQPIEVYANFCEVQGMPKQDNAFITVKFDNGSCCTIAYLADGDKNYSKEKMLITGLRTNIEFDNFKTVTVFKNGKHSKKSFMSLDKGQKEEMKQFTASFSKGIQPIKTEALLLSALTTIKAVESLNTRMPSTLQVSEL